MCMRHGYIMYQLRSHSESAGVCFQQPLVCRCRRMTGLVPDRGSQVGQNGPHLDAGAVGLLAQAAQQAAPRLADLQKASNEG